MKTRSYHYRESGLPNIWLANGFAMHKTEYGEGVSIDNVEGLHKVVGMDLAECKPRLTGAEFRYPPTLTTLASAAPALGRQVRFELCAI